jgi:hypothetical protein
MNDNQNNQTQAKEIFTGGFSRTLWDKFGEKGKPNKNNRIINCTWIGYDSTQISFLSQEDTTKFTKKVSVYVPRYFYSALADSLEFCLDQINKGIRESSKITQDTTICDLVIPFGNSQAMRVTCLYKFKDDGSSKFRKTFLGIGKMKEGTDPKKPEYDWEVISLNMDVVNKGVWIFADKTLLTDLMMFFRSCAHQFNTAFQRHIDKVEEDRKLKSQGKDGINTESNKSEPVSNRKEIDAEVGNSDDFPF